MKQRVVVIAGDSKLDDMMHAMDVFESFKRLAKVTTYELSVNEKFDPIKTVQALKEALEKTGQRVVAIFYPGESIGAYLDSTVECISDGNKWAMLDKVLKYYNYVPLKAE